MQELFTLIKKVGDTRTNILIVGESGTGKELVAQMIHETGVLKAKPFVAVNCGAIPENLMESELFGHKRGSFTGAVVDKVGLFEVASGGTLFLDEVGELPLGMQSKLLRAIQEKAIRRVGGVETIKVDARIIAATNKNLESGLTQGTFREDLYYRLNVIQIKTPPLRHRKEDIPILADHFLKKFNEKFGKKVLGFQTQALEALYNYGWPGNVRELENVIERAFTLENGKKISLSSLPPAIHTPELKTEDKPSEIRLPAPDFSKGPIRLDPILWEIERKYVQAAIENSGGVKKSTALLLDVTFRSLKYRIKKLDI